MLEYWNSRAKKQGLKGVYYIFQEQYKLLDSEQLLSFDASFQFQPFNALLSDAYSLRARLQQRLRLLIDILPKNTQNSIWLVQLQTGVQQNHCQ